MNKPKHLARFALKTILFTAIPMVLVLCVYFTFQHRARRYYARDGHWNSVNVVFMGDSHVETAFDPTRIGFVKNLGLSSESNVFTYYKLKALLNERRQIKTVVLGFGYHSTAGYIDDFVDGAYSNAISSKFFFLMGANAQMSLIRANWDHLAAYLRTVFKHCYKAAFARRPVFAGAYANKFHTVTADSIRISKRIAFQFYNQTGQEGNLSQRNVAYLHKIKRLCDESKIQLILINTPNHPLYNRLVPLKFVHQYEQAIDQLGVQCLDLHACLEGNNQFAPDGDHVNFVGSQHISDTVRVQLQKQGLIP